MGLERLTEDVVIRIDADTIVSPELLATVMPWFWDDSVGGVSGLPMPNKQTPRWLYPLRVAEVYYGVAFLRVAQGAADAVMVMPGMIAAYRRTLVEQLGGFAEGINGEDADITMRIGRLGYRIVTDLDVLVQTEVPEHGRAPARAAPALGARPVPHGGAQHVHDLDAPGAARRLGAAVVDLQRLAADDDDPGARLRAVVGLLDSSVFDLRQISVVAGFLVGLQLIVITLLLLANRQFAAVPFVPAFLLFRMFRAYTAFETILTLRLKPAARAVTTATGSRRLQEHDRRRGAPSGRPRSRATRYGSS